MIALAVLAAVAALLYYTVSGDYAFLRASVLTGSTTGAYHALGDRLAARALKKNGHLKVVATAGSVENLARLVGENGRCVPAFAFVQDGVPTPADAGLTILGRLPQPELLFLLAKRGRAISTFNDLKGASVGIGPEGSGTAYLMQQLLDNSDLGGGGEVELAVTDQPRLRFEIVIGRLQTETAEVGILHQVAASDRPCPNLPGRSRPKRL